MNNSTKNFCQRLIESCEKHSENTAMQVIGDESEVYTFGEMLKQIRSVAYRLSQENVELGDRVIVIGENHPAWEIAYLATLYRGAVCVPLDPHGEIETITNFFENSEAKIAFMSPEMTEKFGQIEERLGRKVPAVVWGNGHSPQRRGDAEEDLSKNSASQRLSGLTNGFQAFDDWATTDFPVEYANEDPPAKLEDNAILVYTSGTTGTPKGVPLTHGNICAELDAIDKVLEINETEKILSLLPLFHVYLQIVNLWLASTKGSRVFYLKELSPDELSKAMIESKMTILASVPRLWYLFHKKIFDTVRAQSKIVQKLFKAMLSTNGFLRDTFNINLGKKFFKKVHDSFGGNLRLAISAGSRFDEKVAIDFHRLGFTIIQGYGLSETSGAATATYIDDNRVGSVGKPMFGNEVKIDNPNSEGVGEVLIRGGVVFKGYYKNEEATKNAFTEDGWFRSGDLGKFDKDGHLYIVGRSKDVIVLPSGKNIHPEDLEVHYAKSPLVEEICVLGVADKASGMAGDEKLVAVVVPDFAYLKQYNIANSREHIRFDLDDLGRELPEYQRVRDYIVRTEPIPRTATRKIKRFELQKEIEGQETNGKAKLEKNLIFTEEDKNLLESNVGQTLIKAIKQNNKDAEEIHPEMNLEIDLRLDSLSRAEVFASMEQAFNIEFEAEQAANALTVGEVIKLVEKQTGNANAEIISADFNWNKIITNTKDDLPEVKNILRSNTLFSAFAFVVLKTFYLVCKIFLRMEVTGKENIDKLDKPFLISPNHQSYLDGFVIPSTYSYSVLKDTFFVGASEYWQNFITRNLAKLLNVVPIDPDASLIKAMKAGAIGLKHGKVLNIYPEGERAYDGKLHEFKKGAAILATELDLPIVPVALDGMHKVWARNSKSIKLAKVKIQFGKPFYAKEIVDPEMNDEAKYEAVTAHLKSEIEKMIEDMRK